MTQTTDRKLAGTTSAFALVLLAAILVACGGPEDLDDSQPTSPQAETDPGDPGAPAKATGPAVALAFADTLPAGSFTPVTEVAIDSTQALYVVADWTGVSASQVESLKLVDPRGLVYSSTIQITLTPTATATKTVTTLPGGIVRATGCVRWTRTPDLASPDCPAGCGVAWQAIDAQSADVVRRFIARGKRRRTEPLRAVQQPTA